MLNISSNTIKESIPFSGAKSLVMTLPRKESQKRLRILTGVLISAFIMLFLPWTQNIRATGLLTTLTPDQRPQTIHATIAGNNSF